MRGTYARKSSDVPNYGPQRLPYDICSLSDAVCLYLCHLSADRSYLRASVKSQIGKIFKTPVMVGTVLMYLLYFLIMHFNNNGLTPAELAGLRNCAVFVAVMTLAIWLFYRFTLKNVREVLEL